MLILALAIMPPVNAQIFKPDIDKDHPAYMKKDFVTALKHYRALAAQGHAPAQYRIGTMYHRGEGLTVDYKKAAYWYREAAMQGYSHAQRELGILLNKGEGALQDRTWLSSGGTWPVRLVTLLHNSTATRSGQSSPPQSMSWP